MRKVGRVPVSARRFDPQSLVAAPPRKFRIIFSRAAVQSRTDGSLSARTQWVIERFKLSLAASPCITRGRGGWLGLTPWSRDRGTARATLGKRLGCFGVSAFRARLAFSIAHVSVRPPCYPGQSHLTSPVGDHDYPCTIFPASPWLKRPLASPRARQVYRAARQPRAIPIWPALSPTRVVPRLPVM